MNLRCLFAALAFGMFAVQLVLCTRPIVAQQPDSVVKKKQQILLQYPQAQLFYKGYSIPDPNDLLSIVPFAVNPSVAQDIGLGSEERKTLNALLQETQGTPSVVRISYEIKPGQSGPTAAERDANYTAILAKRRVLVDELLPPTKQKRLREIAYQIEVSRVGLGNALTQGKLGEDVGVFDNQKTALSEKADRIEKKTREQIAQILEEGQNELLQELTPEQRAIAKECLGTPLYYRSDDYRLHDRKRFED